jgi:probable phosphoglycerate mutase
MGDRLMDIFLVRHGEAAASWAESADPGLSELGWSQAEEVAAELEPRLDPANLQLLSSPLQRAQETAVPLARSLGLEVAIEAAFREVPSPVPLPERQTWLRQFMREQWHEQPDSLHQWRERMLASLTSLQRPTVIFSHFLVINAVLSHLEQRPEILCFWPDNGSATHLRLEAGSLELVARGRQMDTVVN